LTKDLVFAALVLTAALCALPGRANPASPDSPSKAQCESLTNTDFSGIPDAPTQILSSKMLESQGDGPAYCLVTGYIAPSIGIKMALPSAWTGRFMEGGCGGHCGLLLEDEQFVREWPCGPALRRGYACIESDMGHRGAPTDALWGHGNLQAKVDWGYRATHVAALAGKALTEHYYQRSTAKSYFVGSSTGGRQAMQEAQLFPWDFNGVVAISPPVDLFETYMTFAWGYRVLHDKQGKALLDKPDLQLLTDTAVAKCDMDDGVKDGIIGDPLHCAFDPAQLACADHPAGRCLSPVQINAVKQIYAGPSTSKGEQLTPGGPLVGSELGDGTGSMGWYPAYFVGYPKLAAAGLRELFFWPELPRSWELTDFDFDRDPHRMMMMQALYNSNNPDLRAFKAAGGKLLLVQGLNDNAVMPRTTIDYYETVERAMGGREATQSFVRLFLLPGVGHGAGVRDTDRVDFFSAVEAWVEQNVAPERLIDTHLKDGDLRHQWEFPIDPTHIQFTRPLYPYPDRAKFTGRGDANNAANFQRVRAVGALSKRTTR
jgi:pimeloyl-ACP methyl ester carboxylesterase